MECAKKWYKFSEFNSNQLTDYIYVMCLEL